MTRPPAGHRSPIALFGAPLDTGNLGVSALSLSTIAAVARLDPQQRVTVFDNGRGRRTRRLDFPDAPVTIEERGAWISRRLYRPESLWTMDALSRLRPALLPALRTVDHAPVVLDISGGDSFTDLYGQLRLDLVALPKEIALRRGRPLVLLPQTYGPFREARNAERATQIVASADQAWARDADSFAGLQELLGDRFDPDRHRQGVDVAFALPAKDPGERLGDLRAWIGDGDDVVGINVSGLLHNDPDGAAARFGLELDYRATIRGVLDRVLSRTDLRVLLIDHTHGTTGESDRLACQQLEVEMASAGRVRSLPEPLGAMEVKWAIAATRWFCGTRMHSTIAGLSQGIPTAALAYSDKYLGVFETCDAGDAVVDARTTATDEAIDRLWELFESRGELARRLESRMPEVVRRAHAQFDPLLARLTRADA